MTPPVTDAGRRVPFWKVEAARRAQMAALRARAAVTNAPPPRDPVFVVGCPRSGTTLLFGMLARHPAFGSLPTEGHVLWSAYQHPARKGWTSDRAVAADIAPRERRYLRSAMDRVARGRRFLDKTPKNVLRVPYLAELFPTATFVFIRRDPRDTVGSLIEGWLARQGISYRLPLPLRLAEYRGPYWSYVLVPGWRDLIGTSVAEVAARQYADSNEAFLADRALVDPARVVEVRYEDLVAMPLREAHRILDVLELPPSGEVTAFASDLGAHRASQLTPPGPGKWRRRAEDIARVWPQLREVAGRLGYEDVPA